MKTHVLFFIFFLSASLLLSQNVAINGDGSQPHASAILDLQAFDKGLLVPRLEAAERQAIEAPANGLLVFQTDGRSGFYFFDGGGWKPIDAGGANGRISDVDGHIYEVVAIGEQRWLGRNLAVTSFRNGDPIPFVSGGNEWEIGDAPAQTAYNSMPESYGATYGRLYNGYTITDPRGLCPEGWHVPDSDDWLALIDYLGDAAGGILKAVGGWEEPNTGALNSIGFSALPGGYRLDDGHYADLTRQAAFWSAPGMNRSNPEAFILKHDSEQLLQEQRPERQGLSVRCVRSD